jgi:hypothetical protein
MRLSLVLLHRSRDRGVRITARASQILLRVFELILIESQLRLGELDLIRRSLGREIRYPFLIRHDLRLPLRDVI